jgi:ubiquinone/menaquinone biosynthesis C-methylase UbiE
LNLVKLNLGCGNSTPEGWINVDNALGAKLAKIPFFKSLNDKLKLFDLDWSKKIFIHNLQKRFPWKDNSVDVIYCSHVLEHFTLKDGIIFLKECKRILNKQNGVIRIVVPDIKFYVLEYLNGSNDSFNFYNMLNVNYVYEFDNYFKKKLAPFFRHPHKCMYDLDSLLRVLSEIGLEIKIKSPFESQIEDIYLIEKSERTKEAIIVEGKISLKD